MTAQLVKGLSRKMLHKQAAAILNRLLAKGLIEADGEDNYRITATGAEVAQRYAAAEAA
jgi:hypothetical protein